MRCCSWSLLLLAVVAPAAADDPLLARFKGGELRTSEARSSGVAELRGEARSAAVCGAAYRKIFSRIGAQKGLDQQEEFLAELAAARRRLAAAVYRKKRQPNFENRLDAAELEAEWKKRSQQGGDLYQPGVIDMDVLYLRCSVLPAERRACFARAAELDQRLAQGESFVDLIGEERGRSGNANGSYSGTPLERLNADLRELAEKTAPRSFSPWLEAPHGLFRLRVQGRRGAGARPLFLVEDQLRRELAEKRLRAWEEEERRRLDPRSKASIEEILEAAADQAGDTAEAAFIEQLETERQSLLARRAYLGDKASRPSDSELESLRSARAEELEELVLLIYALPANELEKAYRRAGEIAEALTAGAADLPATLAALPGRFAGLRVEQIGPMRRQLITAALPDFAKALAGAAAGTWRGPIPLEGEGLWHLMQGEVPEGPAGGRSLAFVAVLQRSLPPLPQLREELLEPRLAELEAGGVYCRELLGRRFALEILPGPSPTAATVR